MYVYYWYGYDYSGHMRMGYSSASSVAHLQDSLSNNSIVLSRAFPSFASCIYLCGAFLSPTSWRVWLEGIQAPTRIEQSTVIRGLSDLLRAHVPVEQALYVVSSSCRDRIANQLRCVRTSIQRGESLPYSIQKAPEIFNKTVCSALSAVFGTDQVPEVLRSAADSIDDYDAYIKAVRRAITAPMITLLTALVIVGIAVAALVPSLSEMLVSQGAQLPPETQRLLTLSSFLQSYAAHLFVGAGIVGLGIKKLIRRFLAVRRFCDRMRYRMPVFGPLYQMADAYGVLTTLGMLLSAHIPLVEAIELAARVPGTTCWDEVGKKMKRALLSGVAVRDVMQIPAPQLLRKDISYMLVFGQDRSQLGAICHHAADVIWKEKDYRMQLQAQMVQPLLYLFIGGILFWVVQALYFPIFQMVSAVNGVQ